MGPTPVANGAIPVDLFFFFQAEDGIRDLTVTGVQTCALPIALPRQHALDLRLMRPDDVAKAVVQEARRAGELFVAHATRSRGGAPAKNALRLSSARRPMAIRVSCVALPRWGSSTTFSIVQRTGVTAGSRSNTSSPAPAIVPSFSAATSAASATISPRALLIRNAPRFIKASRRASIR